FWVASRRFPDEDHKWHKILVKNHEAICAGVVAGAALMGIATMAIELFVLK
ncbi:MAG: hypothetical protein JRI68_34410, partial [Deltaproteobacteria bacterium]|nr:hypothetical protein [Deltaproteobacteria bacterium]